MAPRLRKRVRLYQMLRSAHLERARDLPPASIVYAEHRYDYDASLEVGLHLVRAGTLRAAAFVLVSKVEVLEVNEPLVESRLVRTVLTVAAARLSAWLRRSDVLVVAYAIENFSTRTWTEQTRLTSRRGARDAAKRLLMSAIASNTDRLAFGTPGASSLYARLLGHRLEATETRLVPALPAACTCAQPSGERPSPSGVLFLGAFSERKGITDLMAAWPEVVQRHPQATLCLIGTGELVHDVRGFAASHASVSLVESPPRTDIHRHLRLTRVLVLPSRPRPGWREQVGLPIVEGLAHGSSIVTTDQTGLAEWLTHQGHAVLRAPTPTTLADALVSSLEATDRAAEVLASLPDVDGRLAADAWLFRPPSRG